MLNEMRAFAAFVEAGSVQATAARLNLTQSAVTRQIQRLEEELSTVLLDRRMKPPQITMTGHAVLERCRSILKDVADLRADCSPARAPSGHFRVGIGYVMGGDELAECIDDIARRFPGVSLSLRTDWHTELIEMVKHGQLDVAVIPARPQLVLPAGVTGAVVGAEPLVFVIGSGHSPRTPTTLAELATLPWIVKPKGTGTREILDSTLAHHGLRPGIVSEVRDENLQLSLVARGLGIALVTRSSVQRHPRAKRLRSCKPRGLNLYLDVVMIRGGPLAGLKQVADAFEAALARRFRPRR